MDPGGYGGRDGLPFRGAPTALESWVLVLTVGRGWRGNVQTGPPHPTEPPTVAALGAWVLVLTVGRGWRGDGQAGCRAWVPYGSGTDLSARPSLLFTKSVKVFRHIEP